MIKLVCFLRRKPGLSIDDFHHHWLEEHGPLIAGTPELARHIVRYEQNHRLPEDRERDAADAPGFDGVTIQWLESMDRFRDFVRDPLYAERIAPDEQRFLDRSSLVVFFTEPEQVVIEEDRARAGVKLLALLRRREGTTPADFGGHWGSAHASLFRDTPEIRRHIVAYHQNPRIDPDDDRDRTGWDGLAEQWYESLESFRAMTREPRYLATVPADEERFVDRSEIPWILSAPPECIIG